MYSIYSEQIQVTTEATKSVNLRFPSFLLLVVLVPVPCDRVCGVQRTDTSSNRSSEISKTFGFTDFTLLVALVICLWYITHTTTYVIQVRTEAAKSVKPSVSPISRFLFYLDVYLVLV